MEDKDYKKEYPLYPKLQDEGEKEAVQVLNAFVKKIKKAAEEAVRDFCVEALPYIESDSWTNFRNEIMDGFRNYNNRKIQDNYDFAEIRKSIYKEFRDDIIADLNQDNLKEIKKLKE